MEQPFTQEHKRYKELLSYISAGIIVTSYTGRIDNAKILEINHEFTKSTGYTLENLDSLHNSLYINLIDMQDRERLQTELTAQLSVSTHYEVTYRLKTLTGGTIWIKESGCLCGESSSVLQGVLIDMTDIIWHQEQLAQSEQLFRITNNASGGAVYDFDFSTGTYLHFENAERIYGVPAQNIIADTKWFGTLSPKKALNAMLNYFYHPDDAPAIAAAFEELALKKEIHYIARSKRANGTFLWTQVSIALIFDENGNPVRRVGHILDIDKLKRHEDELSQSEQLFRITNSASGGAVYDFDFSTGTYLHFENAERIYGVPAEKIISDTKWFGTLNPQKATEAMIDYFYHPDDASIVAEAFQLLSKEQSITYVARSRRADGTYIWTRIHIALIYSENGEPVRRVGHILDIDEVAKQMEELKSLAQEDPLTKIYNKTAAQVIVDTVLKKKDTDLSALMLLDIDNFKGVNDTFGHTVGDSVLVDVCAKLKKTFRDQTLGRVGGDEFIVFVMEMKSRADIINRAEKVCSLFHETYIGSNHDYKISCSIGIAISEDETSFSQLFKKADTALYQAKSQGKDCYCFYEEYEK